jgi:hypothetical protein
MIFSLTKQSNVEESIMTTALKLASDTPTQNNRAQSLTARITAKHLAVDIRRNLDGAISVYHKNNSDFIFWLAQYDDQRLFREDSYSSTYEFLVRGHGISEGSAWRRIRVARLAIKLPSILDAMAKGQISLTVLALIAEAKLSDDLLLSAVAQCHKKTKSEAEKILALLLTKPFEHRKKKDSVRIVGSKWKDPQRKLATSNKSTTNSILPQGQISLGGNSTEGHEPSAPKSSPVIDFFAPDASTSKPKDANRPEICHNMRPKGDRPLTYANPFFDHNQNSEEAPKKILTDHDSQNSAQSQKELIYRISLDLSEPLYERLMHAKVMCNANELADLMSHLLDIYVAKLPDYKKKTFALTTHPTNTGNDAQNATKTNPINIAYTVGPISINAAAAATGGALTPVTSNKNPTKNPHSKSASTQSASIDTNEKDSSSPQQIKNESSTATGGVFEKTPRQTPIGCEQSKSSGAKSQPSTASNPHKSRYIPAQLKRHIWAKFEGQCGFVSPTTGQRCASKKNLEFEHIRPFAKGGSHDESNLMLLCRAHNQYQAIQHFGRSQMDKWLVK